MPTETPTVAFPFPLRRPRKRDLKNLRKRDGIWYFEKRVNGKKEFNGRRTPFTLDTRDLVLAKAKRDAIMKAASGAEIDRILGKESRGAATLKQIFDAYKAGPSIRANAETRKANIADLKRMVKMVRGDNCDPEQFSSAELDKAFVKKWQSDQLVVLTVKHADDLAALEAGKRAMNSTLTHIQSIFSVQALDDYGSLYLPPNIAEFSAALPVPARKQPKPVQLTDAALNKLLEDVVGLEQEDVTSWAIFQLITWGGLRNKETLHAEKAWLDKEELGYRLTMKPTKTFLPKGNERSVIIPAPVAEALLARMIPGDDHLVPARNKSDRLEASERRLNTWLKSKGVGLDGNKIAYRLRKKFLSKISEQQGLLMAQAAGGHSSIRTTQDHYTGPAVMKEPVRIGS